MSAKVCAADRTITNGGVLPEFDARAPRIMVLARRRAQDDPDAVRVVKTSRRPEGRGLLDLALMRFNV